MHHPIAYTIPVTILDMLFVGINGNVVALDKRTGQRIWKTYLKTDAPVTLFPDGQRLVCGNNGHLFSLSIIDGSVVWKNGLKGSGYGNVSLASSDIPVNTYAGFSPYPTTTPTPFPPTAAPNANNVPLLPTSIAPPPALLYPDPSDSVPSVSSHHTDTTPEASCCSAPLKGFTPISNPTPTPYGGAPFTQPIAHPQMMPQPQSSQPPVLVALHNVVFIALTSYLHAINKLDGSIIWRVDLGLKGDSILLVENDAVFIGSIGSVFAVQASNGKILWTNDLPGCGYGPVLLCTASQRMSVEAGFLHRGHQ